TTFIATVAAGDLKDGAGATCCLVAQPDVNRPAVPTADGSVLVFASKANLTGDNPSPFAHIYRYVTADGSLGCIPLPPPAGAPPSELGCGLRRRLRAGWRADDRRRLGDLLPKPRPARPAGPQQRHASRRAIRVPGHRGRLRVGERERLPDLGRARARVVPR